MIVNKVFSDNVIIRNFVKDIYQQQYHYEWSFILYFQKVSLARISFHISSNRINLNKINLRVFKVEIGDIIHGNISLWQLSINNTGVLIKYSI